MLTLRPLKENGQWGAKCRKADDLDENGQRIPDGKEMCIRDRGGADQPRLYIDGMGTSPE